MMNVIFLIVLMLNVVMLSVIMLSVVMLSVVMMSVVMLSDVMLSVIMLSVVMLIVMVPTCQPWERSIHTDRAWRVKIQEWHSYIMGLPDAHSTHRILICCSCKTLQLLALS
jgi:hypothetical protein